LAVLPKLLIIMKKSPFVGMILALFAGAAAAQAPHGPTPAGFYGGVMLRDTAGVPTGIDLSSVSSAWIKYGATMTDDTGSRALMFGGYRFGPRVAVEAALARSDSLALSPARPGMGLALDAPFDVPAQRVRADVYTSYNFAPAFALYGRVGYQQQDALPVYLSLAQGGVPVRQGVNVGVGLRYDVSPAFGLKLEYARFGRGAFDTWSGTFPESDQVQLGVQYRF
jgi:opacity protein-like surface antigen